MTPSIFIAVPVVREATHAQFTVQMAALTAHLSKVGIPSTCKTESGYSISEQRDYLAHIFLESESTHLLFADSDMVFDAGLCPALLRTDKELIGAVYPRRKFNLNKLRKLILDGVHFDRALAAAYDFSYYPLTDNGYVEQHGDIWKLGGIGMGFTLIARSAFERLLAKSNIETYRYGYRAEQPIVRGFFSRIDAPPPRGRLGEDLSFCFRMLQAGGEVWGYSTTKIGHIDEIVHRASFADHIEATRQKSTSPATPATPVRRHPSA